MLPGSLAERHRLCWSAGTLDDIQSTFPQLQSVTLLKGRKPCNSQHSLLGPHLLIADPIPDRKPSSACILNQGDRHRL